MPSDPPKSPPLSKLARAIMRADEGIAGLGPMVADFSITFSMHTERGTVLNSAAMVEEILTEAIGKFMIASTLKKSVFEPGKLLSDFGVKIATAYLFGIISKPVYQELEIIRKVRNRFAHDHKIKECIHPEVTILMKDLSIVPSIILSEGELSPTLRGLFRSFNFQEPRYIYLATCICLLMFISAEAHDATPLRAPRILS